jgi:nucleotidyltransferase AbiEii toxin of type IV toxin-antitoxin system
MGYGARRKTRTPNAISTGVTAEHLAQVVRDIAALDVDDGVVFDVDTISVQEIREQADCPALRVRVAASIGPWKAVAPWDVSTGNPIVPPPRHVTIDRILGEPITLLGYAPETTIAEKGVTILERGITSTRWRDYLDIVQLARRGIDLNELLRSARAVARHRGVTLEPVAPSSPVTAQSHKPNGPHGAAKNTSNLPVRRASTTRSPWSPPTSIRSSSSATNKRMNRRLRSSVPITARFGLCTNRSRQRAVSARTRHFSSLFVH